MNVSLNWLKEFVDIDIGPDDLAHQLTMLGLEIEAVERPGAGIQNVVIGKILEIKPHPDADKLVVCQTDIGTAQPLQIVCGATNMKVGDIVPTAVVGAKLPEMEIGRRKMRGVESQGMMCSARELGLGKDHDGLLILPSDMPIGADAVPLLGLDDVIFEIEVTPNRADWAGMIGVARELAAYFEKPLRLPDSSVPEHGQEVSHFSSITIEDPVLCSRYIGRVITGIQTARTPLWMARRLIHAGQRLVNAVVDVTNYVLLETGQPLHAFDYDKLAEHRIVVRRAHSGESIRTIDGVTRSLQDDMLVIADARVPVAVAGVMGGAESEVGESTPRIVLESACFDPSSIRKTARILAMNTEASQRFQRGADPEMTLYASNRAARLIHEITGAQVAKGVLDAYPSPVKLPEVSLRFDRTTHLLGTKISIDSQRSILKRLHFDELECDTSSATFRVPSWRHDVTREVDLIEEIARFYGYDNIPASVPRIRRSDTIFAPEEIETRKLRRYLVSIGLTELMGLTFSSLEEIKKAKIPIHADEIVKLQNPLSETTSVMRVSLLPNLLNAASLNLRRGVTEIRAFELGHVYLAVPGQPLPNEQARLGIVLSGLRDSPHWGRAKEQIDIYDIKGLLESIVDRLGLECTWSTEPNPLYEEGYAGTVELSRKTVGRYGKVSTSVRESFDLEQDVYLAEMELGPLWKHQAEPRPFEAPSAFPPSLRDIAVLVDSPVPAQAILDTAKAAGGKLLKRVDLFDIYMGKPIPPGKKSVALSLIFQSSERTLTDKDTQKAWDNILKALENAFGAALR